MTPILRAAFAAFALTFLIPEHSFAQQSSAFVVAPCVTASGPSAGKNGVPYCSPVTASNPFPISGTFTATLSGFQPTPAYSQLAVGASSTRVALPAGTVVIVYNTGANAASVTLGNASVVATGVNDIIQPNSWVAFTVGPNVDIAGIEATGAAGTTSLVISGGSGLPTGAGGGGGGGSGGGGPLGVQAISNSQAVNPATSSIWSQTGAPNITTVSGTPITVPDTNQICTSTGWGNQSACVGTPTAGSAYQVAVTSAGYLWVQAVTTGGTPTVNFAIRISNDGGTTWFNRGIFALTNVSPFQINNISNINFAGWLTGGVTNVEVIATTYTGAGSTAITITQGQATPFVTSSATSSSINGTGATAATNVQGNGTSALPVNTNTQQQANVALAAPTAVGTPPTGNIPSVQGGGTTASPVAVDTPTTGNNLYAAVTGPIPPQTSHGVNIGSVEGAGTAGAPDTHVLTVQGIASGTPQPVSLASAPLPTGAATAANQEVTAAGTSAASAQGVQGVTGGIPMPVAPTEYPATAVPITASATGTTAATTATLTNVSGHTTYICGYSVRANATAATTVLDTVTGVITATMSSELWVAPSSSGLGVDEQIFSPCIPASAVSTSIAVVSGAPGAGGLVSVKAWGFSL